jgi:sugar lactone lactonase YvrE
MNTGITYIFASGLSVVKGLALSNGKLYASQPHVNKISVFSTSNKALLATYGTGVASYTGDNGQATAATFNSPYHVSIIQNQLFVSDNGNLVIRVINTDTGIVKTFAGDVNYGDGRNATLNQLYNPYAMTLSSDRNTLYVTDSGSWSIRAWDRTSNKLNKIAGKIGKKSTLIGEGDGGLAVNAVLRAPYMVCYDRVGNQIFIAGIYY